MPDTHLPLNIEAQENNPTSVLNFTRRFFTWRKTQKTLLNGALIFEETLDENGLIFTREHEGLKTHCRFNFKTYDFEVSGFFSAS